MTEIIAVTNQKGGVGKTTTVVNVAAYSALAGRKVLVVDCDPQGNCSSVLAAEAGERSIYSGGAAAAHAASRLGYHCWRR